MKRPKSVTLIGIVSTVWFVAFGLLHVYFFIEEPPSKGYLISPWFLFLPLPLYGVIAFFMFVTVVSILFLKGLRWTWFFLVGYWIIETILFTIAYGPVVLLFPPIVLIVIVPFALLCALLDLKDVKEYLRVTHATKKS